MLFYAGKLTQFLIAPLNLVLGMLLLAWFIKRRRPRTSGALIVLATLLLGVASLPIVAFQLIGLLESRYPSTTIEELPQADAIVVLGGTVSPLQLPRFEPEELAGARVQRAFRIHRAGKAPFIICSGGFPYRGSSGEIRTESEDMRDLLVDFGVPAAAIECESKSRNTNENARFTADLLRARGAKRILLVTSAFHMPRAVALFEKQGLTIIPAPSDPRATGGPWRLRSFLPGADALRQTTQALNEIVGFYGYRLLGLL